MNEINLAQFSLHKIHDVTLFLGGLVFAMLVVILLDYTQAAPTVNAATSPPCFFIDSTGRQHGYGDVDGSGIVDFVGDAILAAKISFNQIAPTADQKKAADVDGNGVVNYVGDATLIAKYAFGQISSFPVCSLMKLPDFAVVDFQLTKTSYLPGETVAGHYLVANKGDAAALADIGFWRDSSSPPACGKPPDQNAQAMLQPGQSFGGNVTFQAPNIPGQHVAWVVADWPCKVPESNESNNTRPFPYQIIDVYPTPIPPTPVPTF